MEDFNNKIKEYKKIILIGLILYNVIFLIAGIYFYDAGYDTIKSILIEFFKYNVTLRLVPQSLQQI